MASTASIRPSIGRILKPYLTLQTSPITPLAILSSTSTAGSVQRRHQQQQQQQQQQRCPFSSTSSQSERRPRRDNNRLRGLSSIHRSGPRFRMNVPKTDLPKPADFEPSEEVVVDPDHGLWQFFYAKDKIHLKPEEDEQHGRAWTVEELRQKSWEDLHRLWWVCCKEQNRIATHRRDKSSFSYMLGATETKARLATVRKTMAAIKHTLTERIYVWEDARRLAASDPEINLSGKGQAYKPASYYEPEEAAAPGGENQAVEEGQQQQSQEEGGDQVLEPELQPEQQQEEKIGAETVDPSTAPPSRPAETQNTTRP